MNTKMKQLLLAIIFLFPAILVGQTIKGKVIDKTEAIPYANVIITDVNQQIITGTTTDENGFFSLQVKAGKYHLSIRFIGYKEYKKELHITKDISLETIVIEESGEVLDEVVIKATKRVIERKIDRLVFNVEKSIAATGGNGIDVLKIAPRVQIENGNIAILGKGASRVMINGRISPLEGDDLVQFLNGLSANDIQKIEVITNPPANYEAAGNGGLINVILKKGAQNSWKNAINVAYNQNRYSFSTLTNNFFYNKNKLSLSASINATQGSFENKEGVLVDYPTNFWDIKVQSKIGRKQYSGRFLIDYALSDKTTIGFQYLGSDSSPKDLETTTSSIFNTQKKLEKTLFNQGENQSKRKNHTVNVHLVTALDSLGKSLSFDVDYFEFDAAREREFITESFFANGMLEGINSAAINNSNQKTSNFSSKIDMNLPLKKVNLSFGAKASFTKSDSDVLYYNTISGSPVLDPTRSNKFNYKEDNLAAYFSGNTSLTEKLQVQFGLRLEETKTEGFNVAANQKNKNKYMKLFPTLYFSYQKNENNSFNFSYGKRINRPNFSLLNPFRYYINDRSYSVGNPFLQPTYNDSFELSHSYKRIYNTSIFLNYITDGFGTVFTSDAVNQTQIITRENYYKQYNYGLSESFSYTKKTWWKSYNSINLLGYYTKFTKGFGSTPKNGMRLYLSSDNTFVLNKTTQFQVNSWYSSKHNSGLFSVGEMFNVSLGLQHHFVKSNVKMSLLFNDIFNKGSLNNYKSAVNGIEQVYRQNESSRNFRISLSYDFGNKKLKEKNRNFGNDEEQRRSNR